MTKGKKENKILEEELFGDLELEDVKTTASQEIHHLEDLATEELLSFTDSKVSKISTEFKKPIITKGALKKQPPPEKSSAKWIVLGALLLLVGGGVGAAYFLKLGPFGGIEPSQPDTASRMEVRLKPKGGLKLKEGEVALVIKSTPPGAHVAINLKSRGKTPLKIVLKKGETYHLMLSKPPNFAPLEKKFTVTEELAKKGEISFQLISPSQGPPPPSDVQPPNGATPPGVDPKDSVKLGSMGLPPQGDIPPPADDVPSLGGNKKKMAPDTEKKGKVNISCTPLGAAIKIGNLPKVKCPAILELSPGSHPVVVEKEGFVSYVGSVSIVAGKEKKLKITLKPVKKGGSKARRLGKGTVSITSTPPATVYWRGKKLGKTPLTAKLPAGRQLLILRGPGGLRKKLLVRVKPRQKISQKVTFQYGKIKFVVKPWADVWINGKKIGQTPMPPYKIREGVYTVTLKMNNLTKKVKVVVEGNKTSYVYHIFKLPR